MRRSSAAARWIPYLFIAPSFLLLFVLVIYPTFFVVSNSFSAKPYGIRTQPWDAAYPGSGPPWSAMPLQVSRCMFGIGALL